MDLGELNALWEQLIDGLVGLAGSGAKAMARFISATAPVDLTDDALTIAVKTEFTKNYIEHHYQGMFVQALEQVLGFPLPVEFVTDQEAVNKYNERFMSKRLLDVMGTPEAPASTPAMQTSQVNPVQPQPAQMQPARPQEQPPHLQPTTPAVDDAPTETAPAPTPAAPVAPTSPDPISSGRISTGSQVAPSPTLREAGSTEETLQQINPKGIYNPKFTFENFVVGESNEFARAAALKVAEDPGKVYNPLFIYGSAGLGKTHLLNAIANYVKNNYDYMRVVYVTSEDFVNDVVASTRFNIWDQFMLKYRAADILLIDDVQFLEGKESSILQLFNTFNALKNNGSAIVLSSDRPPKELDMDERMRSRFIDGLNVEITAPNFEMRYAILQNYLATEQEAEGLAISDDVLMYIAKISTTNIRELDGAIGKIVAYMRLHDQSSIEVEDAQEILTNFFPEQSATKIDIATIQDVVERQYGITHEEMIGAKRTRNINEARQVAMFLARQMTDKSYPDIGHFFGGRDHTTIMHGTKKIEELMNHDEAIYKQVENLTTLINERAKNR